MRWRSVGALTVIAWAAVVRSAWAEPQANVGLTLGAAGVSARPSWWDETRLHLGLHGDVLLGRKGNHDLGVGPFGEVMTSFQDLQAGTGLSVLLPIHPYLPAVVSGGAYGRRTGSFGWEPGVSAQLFWGSRSFNYDSWYVMAGGIRLEMRQGLGDSKERSVIVAAHLDGEVILLPFLLAYEWVRGPREN